MNKLHYIILIFIILILIAISYSLTKENFQNPSQSVKLTNPVTEQVTTIDTSNNNKFSKSIKIVDNENDGHIINEYINFAGFEDAIDPKNQDEIIKCKIFEKNSSFIFSRTDIVVNNDFSCGFYFKPFNPGGKYNYLFSAEDKTGK